MNRCNGLLTPNASKALDKLGPFLALVGHYFKRGSKFLVVVCKPLQQGHALDQLVFLSRLKTPQRLEGLDWNANTLALTLTF